MARYTITFKDKIPVQYPGVTKITGQLDKSFLKKWAVQMMLKYLHKHWIDYVTDEAKKGNFIEFEEKEDYFKMLDEAEDEYLKITDETKIIGNCVHDLINLYIECKMVDVLFDINNSFNRIVVKHKLNKDFYDIVRSRVDKAIEWFEENVIVFLETEQPVCSKKYGGCGTLDILARLKPCDDKDNKIVGGLYVIDVKSSKDFYDGQDLQVAGYKIFREEGGEFKLEFKNDNDKENIETWEKDINLKPIKIDGIGILTTNFKDEGVVKFKDYTKVMPVKEVAFLKLLDYYYHERNRRLKNNPFILKAEKIVDKMLKENKEKGLILSL